MWMGRKTKWEYWYVYVWCVVLEGEMYQLSHLLTDQKTVMTSMMELSITGNKGFYHTSLSVCLSVCLSACLSACLSVCRHVRDGTFYHWQQRFLPHLSACLSVCLSACLPVCRHWWNFMSLVTKIFLPHLSVCLSVCLSLWLSVCVWLYVYPFSASKSIT